MPRIFREITASAQLIAAVAGKKIVLTHVWIKLANDWTAGDLFALQWGTSTQLMYPRDNKGVQHCDEEEHGPENTALRAYYRVASGKKVYLDITYRISP